MNILSTASKAINTIGAVNSIVGNVQSIFGIGGSTNAPGSTSNANFLSKIRKTGVARRNLFNVFVPAPTVLTGTDTGLDLHLFAESVNLPGINFATSDIRRYGHGPSEKKPYAPIFNDISVTFIADGGGDIHKFFYKWMEGTIFFGSPTAGAKEGSKSKIGGLSAYEVNFKDQYRTDLRIVTYNEQNDKIIESVLYGAYPVSITDTPLSWGDTDQFMTITVTFTYVNMQIENLDTFEGKDGVNQSVGLLQKILQVGSAVQVLGALKKPRSIADVVNVTSNAKIAVGGLKNLFGP